MGHLPGSRLVVNKYQITAEIPETDGRIMNRQASFERWANKNLNPDFRTQGVLGNPYAGNPHHLRFGSESEQATGVGPCRKICPVWAFRHSMSRGCMTARQAGGMSASTIIVAYPPGSWGDVS